MSLTHNTNKKVDGMEKSTKNDNQVELAPKLAAQYLAGQLGQSPELWAYRLANWRRPGRKSPIEHATTEAGNPVYRWESLEAFAATQQAQKSILAAPDRPRAGAVPHLDGAEDPHVRVSFAIGAVSQSVFAIDTSAARKLAAMLNKAADIVDRATGAGKAAA